MSEEAFFSNEAGRNFILNFRIYCSFDHDEAGIFICLYFIWIWWIRWGRYQLKFLNLPTVSSNHAAGAILSLYTVYSPQFSNLVKFIFKNVKNCSSSRRAVEVKEIFIIYYFSLPDEGGENKIYQFLSFSVYFWKLWLRQGGISFYGSQRGGEEGADTHLIIQFCLPNNAGLMFWCIWD